MPWIGEWTTAAVAVSITIAVAGLALGLSPRWRPHLVVAMPVVVGLACVLTGAVVLAQGGFDRDALAHIAFGAAGGPDAARSVTVGVAACVAAVALFQLEKWLVPAWERVRRRRRLAMDAPSFLGAELPGRSQAMAEVARVAERPVAFGALSAWAAAGEEFFYRGVLLTGWVGGPAAVALIPLQAAWYGSNHLAFGLPAVLGKTLLGIALGIAAVAAGLLPALAAHLLYQVLVFRQFRHPPIAVAVTAGTAP